MPILYNKLKQYAQTDTYPFHMPGHKRNPSWPGPQNFQNPYALDITEIDGFDNLHHPQGILKSSMEWAASLYKSDKTYYLINGSSCGILSAISGTATPSGTILLSRNCHKSAYHGVILNNLKTQYIYPQFMNEYGLQCGLSPEKIDNLLKDNNQFNNNISAVFLVSPTYDGIVSDIKTISRICHSYGIPLIVDEAHGAHFRYSNIFPVSALELGADIVIQSVHKTLPCFTQSALLHIKEGLVDREKIEQYLQIYESSSPSYLLMAGIEHGISWMEGEEGKNAVTEYSYNLLALRQKLESMKHLKILGKEAVGTKDIYDIDISKIIISTKNTDITGIQLCNRLRQEYHLEMEMCTEDYVTAITTIMDTKEGLNRLGEALLSIDRDLKQSRNMELLSADPGTWEARSAVTMNQAWNGKKEQIPFKDSAGKIAAEFIYLYPPGIPIAAPGERITEYIIETVLRYQSMGLPVQGMRDMTGKTVSILTEGE